MFPRYFKESKSEVLQGTGGQQALHGPGLVSLSLNSPAHLRLSPPPAILASFCPLNLQSLLAKPLHAPPSPTGMLVPKCLHGWHLLVLQVLTQVSPLQRGFPDHLLYNSFPWSLVVMLAPLIIFLQLLLGSETFSFVYVQFLPVCTARTCLNPMQASGQVVPARCG